jgi:septation ring formation regulator EzrA
MTDYEKVLGELETEVEEVEDDFSNIEGQDGEKTSKEVQAENLLNEIHEQIEFLEEQMKRIQDKE